MRPAIFSAMINERKGAKKIDFFLPDPGRLGKVKPLYAYPKSLVSLENKKKKIHKCHLAI